MAWGDHRTFVDLHAKDRKVQGDVEVYTVGRKSSELVETGSMYIV